MSKYSVDRDRIERLCNLYGVNYTKKTYHNFMGFLDTYLEVRDDLEYLPKSMLSDGLWKEAPALFKAMSLKEGMSKEMIESFLAIMIQSGQFDIILTGTFEAMKKFSNDGEVYCKIINLLYIDREPHKNIELENMLGYAHSTYQLKKEYAIMSFGLMFWKQILDHWDNSTEEMFMIEQELGRDGGLSSRRMQEAMADSIG